MSQRDKVTITHGEFRFPTPVEAYASLMAQSLQAYEILEREGLKVAKTIQLLEKSKQDSEEESPIYMRYTSFILDEGIKLPKKGELEKILGSQVNFNHIKIERTNWIQSYSEKLKK